MFECLDRREVGTLERAAARSWFRGLGWCLDDASFDTILDEARDSSEIYDEGHRVISLCIGDRGAAASPGTAASSTGAPSTSAPSAVFSTPRRVPRPPSSSPAAAAQSPQTWRRDLLRSPPTTGGWPLPRLLGSALRHRNLCGPDLGSLQSALRLLARGESVLSKDWLREVVAEVQSETGFTEADLEELLEVCGIPSTAKDMKVDTVLQKMLEGICQPKPPPGSRRASSRASSRTGR